MKGKAQLAITEWEWFKLQLRLHAVERSGELWTQRFSFDDEAGVVTCAIWCETTQQLIDKKADRSEQLSFYENWVSVGRIYIAAILQPLPSLSAEFDTQNDLVFEILYDYGMGASLVCEFKGDQVRWLRDA